ncbi:MAG: DNA polymerase Y family protein [Phyllobacteriaceae bacterium]|nr:DNA polymerase Y family protein [Phyllobacteriaceae bacterium]
MRRLVSLWFPAFPVERFIRARRKLRAPAPPVSLPFALVERGSKGLRLAAVNMAARSFGLMRGQRLADARAAVPDLLSEAHEPEQDRASLLGLCRWMERYSPWVAPDPPDGILMEVTGIPHLFGGEAAMRAGMVSRLAGYGFTARVAFAPTLGAAWALARYGGEGEESVQGLPVEALRIDSDAARTLRRLGLKTIGSLISLPRASLARRFRGESIHENVLLRLDEIQGQRAEPLNAINPETSVMAHRAFMEPVITHEGLEAVLRALCGEAARDLQVKGEGALRLILKLFRSDGGRVQVPAGLSAPSHEGGHLFRLLAPKLEALDAGFGIDAMTLEVREAGAAVNRQYGFMEEGNDKSLAELNDRVMNRQEREITALEAVASHIPERSERPQALSVVAKTATMPGMASRPLMIFTAPEQARVIASVPDGPPMSLTWRRVTRRIIRAEGPERIAPEWWQLQGNERPRDYYSIEDDKGRRYWIYREGLYGEDSGPPPKWFVHGLSA